MPSRHVKRGIFLLLAVLFLASGCSRPIVRQPGPIPGGPGGLAVGGPIEQDLQVVQTTLKPIYFAYDSFTLSPEAQSAAQYNADILKRAPQFGTVAEGHCDERGTAEYNLALGDRRARAVVEYMVTLGIPPNKFSTVSYGSELPVDTAHNEEAWSKNRRVYLRVSR